MIKTQCFTVFFRKKQCVLSFFDLTKNIITLKTSVFNVFRVRWGITVYQNCFPKYILQHRVADRSGFNRKSSTIIGKIRDTQHQIKMIGCRSSIYYCPHVWSERWNELKSQVKQLPPRKERWIPKSR